MCKQAQRNRARIEFEEREQRLKEKLDAMTEEERIEYYKEQKARSENATKILATAHILMSQMRSDYYKF